MKKWYMQLMINLLNCSPNLENLRVYFLAAISCLTHKMKTVELCTFDNIENEVEFARFFLKHGRVLQKLSIEWKRAVEKSEEIMQRVIEVS
ncbi:hypothetical protein ACOSP7_003672 [Xanthoceras sorbifolium]